VAAAVTRPVSDATAAALAVFAVTALVAAADEVFVVSAAGNYPSVWGALNDAATGAESLVFGAVGVLIVVRRGSAIGWLLSAMGLAVAIMSAASSYPKGLSPTAYQDLAAQPIWLAPFVGPGREHRLAPCGHASHGLHPGLSGRSSAAETLQPAHASLWLRRNDSRTPTA